MKIFNLPDLGEGLPDAEIHEWHVKEGEVVAVDQLLVSMETAKAIVEVPAPAAGKIVKLYGKQGDVIETGAPLAEFACNIEQTERTTGTVAGSLERSDVILEAPVAAQKKSVSNASINASVKVMPAVRTLAKKLNIDLIELTGTGANHSITLKDVERAASVPKVDFPHTQVLLKSARRAMAQAMIQSHQSVVPVTLFDHVDIGQWKGGEDITVRLCQAIVVASRKEPHLNAWFSESNWTLDVIEPINIGMAMDTPAGLFVPVLKGAENLTAQTMRLEINRFKKEVSGRSIAQDQLKGATITLSNFGKFAGLYGNPIIVPPQVAILGVGRMHEAAGVKDGQVVVSQFLPLSLSFDHRAVTGGEATRFLEALMSALSQSNAY